MKTRTPIKPTGKIALWSMGIGALIAIGIAFLGGPWWLDLIIGLLAAGAIDRAILERVALERVVNRDHDPDA